MNTQIRSDIFPLLGQQQMLEYVNKEHSRSVAATISESCIAPLINLATGKLDGFKIDEQRQGATVLLDESGSAVPVIISGFVGVVSENSELLNNKTLVVSLDLGIYSVDEPNSSAVIKDTDGGSFVDYDGKFGTVQRELAKQKTIECYDDNGYDPHYNELGVYTYANEPSQQQLARTLEVIFAHLINLN